MLLSRDASIKRVGMSYLNPPMQNNSCQHYEKCDINKTRKTKEDRMINLLLSINISNFMNY